MIPISEYNSYRFYLVYLFSNWYLTPKFQCYIPAYILQVQTNKKAIETQKSEYIIIPNASDLKFRPIVAGTTNRHSKLIDILQQPRTK